MRLLQTGDLHLGKLFYDHSLYEDQKYILGCIIEELRTAKKNYAPYDALLICGDIYDRAVPPPDAVLLFDEFLTTVHNFFPSTAVCLIAGNHDSPRRLSFASKLIEAQGIHICTGTDTLTHPVMLTTELLDGSTERLAVYQIPYLTPGSLSAGDTQLRTQQELVQEAVNRIYAAHLAKYPGVPAVVSVHLFAQGSQSCDSERVCIGNIDQVSPDIFRPFAYTAAGHLHTCQQRGERLWYAGSPLSYSFGEQADKYLLSVSLDLSDTDISHDMPLPPVTVQKIRLSPLHSTVRLHGSFESFLNGTDFDNHAQDYIEICCTDTVLTENPMVLLKTKFPRLLSFRQDEALHISAASGSAKYAAVPPDADGQPAAELFDCFLRDVYGADSDILAQRTEERELFVRLANELAAKQEEEQ